MRHVIRAIVLGTVAVLSVTLLGAAPSQAADPPGIATALQRISDGNYTAADIALIKNFPDIAAQVPDPRPGGVVETVRVIRPDGTTFKRARTFMGSGSGTWCNDCWVQTNHTQKSLLGFTIYIWHHRVQAHRSGGIMQSWALRTDFVTNVDGVVEMQELSGESHYGMGTTKATSFRQRHMKYCVLKYGCYSNVYPYSWIYLYGSGSFSWEGNA